LDGLDAVLLRHEDVQDDQVHGRAGKNPHPGLAVRGLEHRVARVFQIEPDDPADGRVIVDDQNGFHENHPCDLFRENQRDNRRTGREELRAPRSLLHTPVGLFFK
jgi:hypothetical protein